MTLKPDVKRWLLDRAIKDFVQLDAGMPQPVPTLSKVEGDEIILRATDMELGRYRIRGNREYTETLKLVWQPSLPGAGAKRRK